MPLEGPQIVDAREVHRLKTEMARLRQVYVEQRAVLRALEAGKEKGLAGWELSKIGKAGRELKKQLDTIERAALLKGVVL